MTIIQFVTSYFETVVAHDNPIRYCMQLLNNKNKLCYINNKKI